MLPVLARTAYRVQERLLGRPTFRIFRHLEQSQRWPRERLDALRTERLRGLVAAAYAHTPYWRELMDRQGIRPDEVCTLDDLRRFPLLEKATLRERLEEMVWRDEGPRLHLTRTSGSTNEALQFYTNSNREAHVNAARMRGRGWAGIRRGDREMYFWGSPVELSTQDRVKRFRDRLINDGLSNGFELTPDRVRGYLEHWRRWRPSTIFGYPSSFVLMVRMCQRQGLDVGVLKGLGLRNLGTTSEMLIDADREIISQAFGVPVYDSYGVREGGLIGHECERFNMHTMDEQLVLETIDPDTLEPTDGEGELVLTNLVSRVMPVIRYRTGDAVTLSDQPCPCGRTLRTMRISGGRIADFVVTRQGKWVVGYSFIYIARSVPGIVKFQVRQEQIGRLDVLLAVDERFGADGPERVRRAVLARLGSDDEIVVRVVDDIAPAPSGKYRPVVSTIGDELRRRGQHTLTEG